MADVSIAALSFTAGIDKSSFLRMLLQLPRFFTANTFVNSLMKGLVFSVKRYSVHDGPGIRVTFFMKGCPLSCAWCHNPEGISPIPETVNRNNRVGDREFPVTEEVGKFYSIDDIVEIIERERVFLNQSKGGVTFSGGEPMIQSAFLSETLKTCKDLGYHTTVDTSGYASRVGFESVLPHTDLFLFDIKHLDDTRHMEMTGVSNTLIIDNYMFLLKTRTKLNVRIPIVPGFNDDPVHVSRLINFLSLTKTEALTGINLLPYHKIGLSKYKRFHLKYRIEGTEPPSKEEMNHLREMFLEVGVKVRIGG